MQCTNTLKYHLNFTDTVGIINNNREEPQPITNKNVYYVGYSESEYRLRISLAHPRDCHFAHVHWLPLSTEKPQTPFRKIRVMFMFVPVR